MRILSDCLMPNHWHFVLWPEKDGDLGQFMQRLTVTQVTRWHKHYNMLGMPCLLEPLQKAALQAEGLAGLRE